MPIYEYTCECGARLESIERMGAVRERCGELCTHAGQKPPKGEGQVERVFSTGMIRGDGHEAKEPTFDPCKKSNRPGGGCGPDEY
jgi:predicted nucleic acid-binding Zn ribbon protein